MYAKVVVDVPARQVNHTFDYAIPGDYQDILQAGMRVIVPFGKRLVQGFVIALVDETDFQGEVAVIQEVLDVEPVLLPELLSLGQYMAEKTYAFQINCYQTMLPTMLKSNYQKQFRLTTIGKTNQDLVALFGQEEFVEPAKEDLPTFMHYHKQGLVTVHTRITDKKTVKTEDWIIPLQTIEWYEQEKLQLRSTAKKQKYLLEIVQQLTTPVLKKEVQDEFGFTHVDLKKAIEKQWLVIEKRVISRDPYATYQFTPTTPLPLNVEQQQVFNTVMREWNQKESHVYLLQGVTGSGKTELYLQWIAKAIQHQQTALMLVPEIALTPQMVERFKARFGTRVAVLHSGLSAGEKYDEWLKIRRKEADIVVGARSSIFAPLENVGIIILDEEHESSYKQDESPRYHARDIAIWRGNYHKCPVILGSATPSLESRARADKQVYHLLRLTQRAKQQALPNVEIIDMREEFLHQRGTFSRRLQESIRERLRKQEQVVLLLNRRGYSSFVMCRDCGHVLDCPNCDISLTLHMDTKSMKCHYCGHQEAIPHHCPKCNGNEIRYYGTGTQKVQEELEQLFPAARVLRMDVDTTRKKGQHEQLLQQFETHEADILLGTQMIAKGLDFPNVTLVGVINADTAMHLPDFRAFERTFQLLTQVAGRAGRGQLAGEVIIQTFNPDHYVIQLAKHHDYEQFYRREMYYRHKGNYPPYYFTTMITISDEQEGRAVKKAYEIRRFLEKHLETGVLLLGPTAKSVARVNNRYYFQLLIKYKHVAKLPILLAEIMNQAQKEKGLTIQIDAEPLHFL